MSIFSEIFTTEGRLNRESYFKQIVIILVIVCFVVGIPMHLGIAAYTGNRQFTIASFDNPVTNVIFILYYILTVMPRIRRLHDLGHSGYFLLVVIIAFISMFLVDMRISSVLDFAFSLYLFFTPGDKSANKYGVYESASKINLSKESIATPAHTPKQRSFLSIFNEIYHAEGRLNRLGYVKYMIILALIMAAAKFTTSCMATLLTGDPNGSLVMMITYALALVAGAGNIMLMIRRLHDLDKTGWFAAVAIIPVLGFILSIYLFCAKGTEGSNRYGEAPL